MKRINFIFCVLISFMIITCSKSYLIASTYFQQTNMELGLFSAYFFQSGAHSRGARLYLNDNGKIREILPDSDGKIEKWLSPGDYEAVVKIGRISKKVQIKVFKGEESRYFFYLTHGGTIEIEFDLPQSVERGVPTAFKEKEKKGAHSTGGTGFLRLHIVNIEDKNPIKGANAVIKGVEGGCKSDEKGICEIYLPSGNYTIGVIHPEFSIKNIKNIVVTANSTIERVVNLAPAGMELQAFKVTAPRIEGSFSQMAFERKNVSDIIDIIGTEQFKKSGDSDAAQAVKRATGITVVDDKYVFIRGLGGRYNVTLLNGAQLPSPEPTKRVVPLDIFPTGVLKSIVLKKTYTPDMPGAFGGGAVILKTKSIPESSFLNLGMSLIYMDLGTWERGYTYKGGKRDWTGIDDGTRELPFTPKEHYDFNDLKYLATKFKNNSSLNSRRFPPGMGLGISGGKLFEPSDGLKLGLIFSGMYENKWHRKDVLRNIYNNSSRGLVLNNGGVFHNYLNDIKVATFLSAGIKKDDTHRLNYTFLLSRYTTDRTQIYDGTDENSNVIRTTGLRWQERELTFNQLSGGHRFHFLKGVKLDWQLDHSRATMDMPDERSYTYWFMEQAGHPGGGFYELVNIPGQNLKHEYTTLTDDGDAYRVFLELPFEKFVSGSISVGKDYLNKDRISRVRRYTFDTIGNIPRELLQEEIDEIFSPENVEKYFVLRDQTFYNDTYTGDLEIKGWFINVDVSPFEWLRIQGGSRWERLYESVRSYEILSPTEISSRISVEDSYPSLNISIKPKKNMQIRIGYSETMTYPDFLELSNSIYIDPITSERIIGNPGLKPTTLKNYDLRFEWYFNELDTFSFAYFYKKLENPIERTYRATSNRPYLSFMNADTATIEGIEIDGRKGLGFIAERFEPFYVAANVSFTKSRVEISKKGILTTTSRELQGQSPYVINLQAGYDNLDTGLTVSVLYNVFGKRIRGVGIFGQPDQYEQPFHQLDLVVIKDLGKHLKLTFKARNLLDDEVEITQGDKVSLSYKKGMEFYFGLNYSFP